MDLLERFKCRNRTAERHNRIALRIGGRETGCQVRHAGARGCDCDSGFAGHPTDATGDERCVLFMSANDSLNLRINQRIENSVNLGPRHTENMGDALRLEYAHDELSTCLSSDARLFGHVHP